MGEIVLWIIIIAAFAMVFRIAYLSDKKYKWFKKLVPGDKIRVMIYSQRCECIVDATVTHSVEAKYVRAEMSPEVLDHCKQCAELNSLNANGEVTCWYKVNLFKKEDCGSPIN